MRKNKPPYKVIWALYDNKGVFFGTYSTLEDAHQDAWGPRFSKYTCRMYKLVPLKDTPKQSRMVDK